MADFFGDLLGAISGQQSAPQQTILDPSQAYAQGIATSMAGIPALNSYNNALSTGMVNTGLLNENQIYGTAANGVRQGAYQSILDNLNLGNQLSPELQSDITRKLSETGAATGFGYSPAGAGNVLLQTGLEADALGRQRRMDALSATGQLPMSRFQYQSDRGLTPLDATDLAYKTQAAQDEVANVAEQTRQSNFASLLNTGGRILGMVGGGLATGGNPMGIMAGGNIGGSLFKGGGVAGYGGGQQGAGQNAAFGSLLGVLQGMGKFGTPGINPNSGYNPSGFTMPNTQLSDQSLSLNR